MKKVLFVPFLLISSSLMIFSCTIDDDSTEASQNNSSRIIESTQNSSSKVSQSSSNISYSVDPNDYSVARYLPWIYSLTEDDVESVTYEALTHKYQGDYSFGDHLTTYVSSKREDLTETISFLKTSQVQVSMDNLYPTEPAKAEVTFTMNLKNGKDLVIYGTDTHEFNYIYFDRKLVQIIDLSAWGASSKRFFFTISLPKMSNNLGYSYQERCFYNCTVRDKVKSENVYAPRVDKIRNMIFTDDTFETSEEYNDFNRYSIINANDMSYIVFENSKQFRVFAGIGVIQEVGRYRITNDVSFDDLLK